MSSECTSRLLYKVKLSRSDLLWMWCSIVWVLSCFAVGWCMFVTIRPTTSYIKLYTRVSNSIWRMICNLNHSSAHMGEGNAYSWNCPACRLVLNAAHTLLLVKREQSEQRFVLKACNANVKKFYPLNRMCLWWSPTSQMACWAAEATSRYHYQC